MRELTIMASNPAPGGIGAPSAITGTIPIQRELDTGRGRNVTVRPGSGPVLLGLDSEQARRVRLLRLPSGFFRGAGLYLACAGDGISITWHRANSNNCAWW